MKSSKGPYIKCCDLLWFPTASDGVSSRLHYSNVTVMTNNECANYWSDVVPTQVCAQNSQKKVLACRVRIFSFCMKYVVVVVCPFLNRVKFSLHHCLYIVCFLTCLQNAFIWKLSCGVLDRTTVYTCNGSDLFYRDAGYDFRSVEGLHTNHIDAV